MMVLGGALAVTLNLLSIAAIAFASCIIVLSAVWPFVVKRAGDFAIGSRKNLLWLWVSSPWLVAFATLALFSTTVIPWVESVAHWHHWDEFSVLSWHSFSLLGFVLISCVIIANKFRGFIGIRRKLSMLFDLTETTSLPNGVNVLNSDFLSAFTCGVFRPQCYLTSGLVKRLKCAEQDIVVAHELAHINHKDTLSKPLFAILAAFFPRFVERSLVAQYSLVCELLADQQVAEHHSVESIAATLVKVAKIQRSQGEFKADLPLSYFAADHLKIRVRYLLIDQPQRVLPKWMIFSSTVVLAGLCMMSVDSSHHLIETLFAH